MDVSIGNGQYVVHRSLLPVSFQPLDDFSDERVVTCVQLEMSTYVHPLHSNSVITWNSAHNNDNYDDDDDDDDDN